MKSVQSQSESTPAMNKAVQTHNIGPTVITELWTSNRQLNTLTGCGVT